MKPVAPELPAPFFTRPTLLPASLRLQRWCDGMRLTRWAHALHARLRNWAGHTRWASPRGEFIYHREGRDYPITFDGRNHQFHAIYDDCYREGYEPETVRLIVQLLPGARGAFFDVGANWGYYSLAAAAVPGFVGEVFPFEPNPRVYADLQSVILQAGLKDRVHAQAAGVGATDGELVIEETDDFHTGLTRLVADGAGVRVPVRQIDHSGLPDPAFIKIDAEGMEAAILKGAQATLIRARPHLIFESFLDLLQPENTQRPLEFLQSLDYCCFMPVLVFERAGRVVFTTYGDDANQLLEQQPTAASGLVALGPKSRFLTRSHINVFACHVSRLKDVWAAGILNVDELVSG